MPRFEFERRIESYERYYIEVKNVKKFKKELEEWIEENGEVDFEDLQEEFVSVDAGVCLDPNDDDNAEYEHNERRKELYGFLKENFSIDVNQIKEKFNDE